MTHTTSYQNNELNPWVLTLPLSLSQIETGGGDRVVVRWRVGERRESGRVSVARDVVDREGNDVGSLLRWVVCGGGRRCGGGGVIFPAARVEKEGEGERSV